MDFKKQGKDEVRGGYTCFIQKAPTDYKYADFKSVLVDDFDQLVEVLKGKKGIKIGFDTETKGLNPTVEEFIVGFSFSFDHYSGYYVPMRHRQGKNINRPLDALKLMFKCLQRNKVLLYNAAFDLLALKYSGFDYELLKTFDVQSLVFNADTNIKGNSLKWAASHMLGRDRITFEETVGKGISFDYLDPVNGVEYASKDASDTLALYNYLFKPLNEECPATIKMDNDLSRVLPFYLDNEVTIDKHSMQILHDKLIKQKMELEIEIHSFFEYLFPISSSLELEFALRSKGLDTGVRTAKTGGMAVGEEDLSRLNHPIAKKLIKYASVCKQLSSYVDKFCNIDKGRFNLLIYRAPTGRFASSDKEKSGFYISCNSQNFTKPSVAMWEAVDTGDIDSKDPELVLGYKFNLLRGKDEEAEVRERDGWVVEGFNPENNVRLAVTVPDRNDFLFFGIDYSMQELKIAGGLSKEPVFLEAFRNGEDLHKKVAIQMWGIENYDKGKRKKAKTANFGLLYDGTGYTLHHNTGAPLDECEEIYTAYWEAVTVLKKWKRDIVNDAMSGNNGNKHCAFGTTYTPFGRPRRLGWYFNHQDYKRVNFGKRSVCSHKVQGCGGDVMRIVLKKMYDNIFKKYPNDVKFVTCVHDELDLAIRKECVYDFLPKIMDLMLITPPGSDVPLNVEPEIGFSYGMIWPFHQDETGRWVPKRA